MAADLTATLTGSVLTVEGTEGHDRIIIRNDGSKITIDGISIQSGGVVLTNVPRVAVSSLMVDALAGNDYVGMFDDSAVTTDRLPMTVNGGWGNDTIFGGSAADKLYGVHAGEALARSYDSRLGLYVDADGDFYNLTGKKERWLRGNQDGLAASTGWYFITPDGSVFNQTEKGQAIGEFVVKLDPTYHRNVLSLADSDSRELAAALDKSLELTPVDERFNFHGKQERWLQDSSQIWYFMLPDGSLNRQTIVDQPIGTEIAKFDPSYWADYYKLANASTTYSDADKIQGGAGDDYIDGGADHDQLVGGHGQDTVRGDTGNDEIRGGMLNSFVIASNDADRLFGGKGDDRIYGGNGNDQIWGEWGNDYLSGDQGDDLVYGGWDNDSIFGGDGNDRLRGDHGNDVLRGGIGNDRLEGGAGNDQLFGDSGDDWLDAGSASEFASGGVNTNGAPERDINAWVTTIAGATEGDITQGNSLTCWILASMGSASKFEDLSRRITYLGNGVYRVNVYNRIDNANPWTGGFRLQPEYVRFDGTRISSDPGFSAQEGETWMIIMHRAIIQAAMRFDPTQSLTNPHSGNALDALSIITGRWGVVDSVDAIGTLDNLVALTQTNRVVLNTKALGLTTLIAGHSYSVTGRIGNNVLLYNPHGATVTITWEQLKRDTSTIGYV